MIPIKVVFQGGGAKLVTLMAAASVLEDLERGGEIQITRVVGVSAGSIVAVMLASRHPFENYRLRAIDGGKNVIAEVAKLPGIKATLWNAYWGKPLLPEMALTAR